MCVSIPAIIFLFRHTPVSSPDPPLPPSSTVRKRRRHPDVGCCRRRILPTIDFILSEFYCYIRTVLYYVPIRVKQPIHFGFFLSLFSALMLRGLFSLSLSLDLGLLGPISQWRRKRTPYLHSSSSPPPLLPPSTPSSQQVVRTEYHLRLALPSWPSPARKSKRRLVLAVQPSLF